MWRYEEMCLVGCDVSRQNLKMDAERIVMYEKGWGHFKIFNRQTLELESVMN